ncbi:MAG: hypothetical protein RMK57_02385 [Bryobacterales bacterium]|nr:hypothetical protein [Bryobacteraceae bacterium]MDW8353354.1 hypothetical protein [Bryobacterales bacterium]
MPKPVVVTTPFPDPRETARVLGISAARRKRLEQMLENLWAAEEEIEAGETRPSVRALVSRRPGSRQGSGKPR